MFTNKIFILDFYDSFTFNIASDLSNYFSDIEVIKYDIFLKYRPDRKISKEIKFAIVLGPGPGHPNEYLEIIDLLTDLKSNSNIFIFGICLGHQLIAMSLGFNIKNSNNIKHGEAESIFFNNKKYLVQRYNSLAVIGNCPGQVIAFEDRNEIFALKGKNLFSVQFHPESVGTQNGSDFYIPMIDFINGR